MNQNDVLGLAKQPINMETSLADYEALRYALIDLHERMGRIEDAINGRIRGEYKGFPVPENATSCNPLLARILALTKGTK